MPCQQRKMNRGMSAAGAETWGGIRSKANFEIITPPPPLPQFDEGDHYTLIIIDRNTIEPPLPIARHRSRGLWRDQSEIARWMDGWMDTWTVRRFNVIIIFRGDPWRWWLVWWHKAYYKNGSKSESARHDDGSLIRALCPPHLKALPSPFE